MWRDVGVWEQSSGDGRECDEEVVAEVCAETGDEACGGAEGDGFLDIEVQAGEGVGGDEGAEWEVVGFELVMCE